MLGIENTMDLESHFDVLQIYMLSNAERMVGANLIFMHGNAAAHTLHVTKTFLKASDVFLLNWPAKSLIPNIIDND